MKMMTSSSLIWFLILMVNLISANECVGEKSLNGACGEQSVYIESKSPQFELKIDVQGLVKGYFDITFGEHKISCRFTGELDESKPIMKCPMPYVLPVTLSITNGSIRVTDSSGATHPLINGNNGFIIEGGKYYTHVKVTFPESFSSITISLTGATFVSMLPSTKLIIIVLSSTLGPVIIALISIAVIWTCSYFFCRKCAVSCCRRTKNCCCSGCAKAPPVVDAEKARKVDADEVVKKKAKETTLKASTSKEQTTKKSADVKPELKASSAPAAKKPKAENISDDEGLKTCKSDSFTVTQDTQIDTKEKVRYPLRAPPVPANEMITIGKTLEDESEKMKLTESPDVKEKKEDDDDEVSSERLGKNIKGLNKLYLISHWNHKKESQLRLKPPKCPIDETTMKEKFKRMHVLWPRDESEILKNLFLLPLNMLPEYVKEAAEFHEELKTRGDVPKTKKEKSDYNVQLEHAKKIDDISQNVWNWRTGVTRRADGLILLPWAADSFVQLLWLSEDELRDLWSCEKLSKPIGIIILSWIHDYESYLLWVPSTTSKDMRIKKKEKRQLLANIRMRIAKLMWLRHLYLSQPEVVTRADMLYLD